MKAAAVTGVIASFQLQFCISAPSSSTFFSKQREMVCLRRVVVGNYKLSRAKSGSGLGLGHARLANAQIACRRL